MHVLLPFIGKDDCEGDDGQTELSNKVDDEKVFQPFVIVSPCVQVQCRIN